MLTHYRYSGFQPYMALPARMAVIAFFAMSGYVLTRSWNGDFPVFLARRFVRLWPVYALCLLAGSYVHRLTPVWPYYFWFPFYDRVEGFEFDPPMWSLFVEAWAMLFMPFIVWCGRSQLRFLIGVCFFAALARFETNAIYGALFVAGAYWAKAEFHLAFLETPIPQWLGRISYSL